jgi:acetylornithine deacetylase/succinyl-diaminopimelate desuccinylase-like protein
MRPIRGASCPDPRFRPGRPLRPAGAWRERYPADRRLLQLFEAELVTVSSTAGPAETALDQPIMREALVASSRHGVTLPQPGGLAGGCDLVHFRSAGSAGIVVGPGALDVAHQPDAYVPKDDLARAALIYRDIAVAMLRP